MGGFVHRVGRRAVIGLGHTRPGERVLRGVLGDDRIAQLVVNILADRVARESTFAGLPKSVDRFEDCAGLLSSNQLNHGVSRLMLEEAVYVYRLVRGLDRPAAVELGRYRGGTTFLLAAAGADVLSIDNDPAIARFDEALVAALRAHGLSERVTLRLADSQTYVVEPASFDLVFVDADHSYEGARADVERWLPALRSGGNLLLHDAVRPHPPTPWRDPLNVAGVRRLNAELQDDRRVSQVASAGTLVHFIVTNSATALDERLLDAAHASIRDPRASTARRVARRP